MKNGLQSEAGGVGGERGDYDSPGPRAAPVTKCVPSRHLGAKLTAQRQKVTSARVPGTFIFLLLINDLYFVWVFREGGLLYVF